MSSPPCSKQPLSFPNVIAAVQGLQVYQCSFYDIPLSLGVDTGASCNLLSSQAYAKLKDLFNLPLQPADNSLFNVQGSSLNVLGTVILSLSLTDHLPPFEAKFFVTPDFVLHSDGLLGLDSLVTHGIDVFPQLHAISYKDDVIPAMDISAPLLASKSPVCTSQRAYTTDHGSSLPDFTESKRSVSAVDVCSAVVIGDQRVSPMSAVRLPVRVANAPVDSCVLSLPDSVRVHHLALESTLSCVRADNVTDALVTNLTGAPISLKNGVLLGSFEICDSRSFDDPPHLIASVSHDKDVPHDTAVLIPQLSAHVQVLDFPSEKSRLLDLLVKHKPAVALPDEPLGVTNRITHHIQLQPNTRPSFVPSYRLPHSQRAVV